MWRHLRSLKFTIYFLIAANIANAVVGAYLFTKWSYPTQSIQSLTQQHSDAIKVTQDLRQLLQMSENKNFKSNPAFWQLFYESRSLWLNANYLNDHRVSTVSAQELTALDLSESLAKLELQTEQNMDLIRKISLSLQQTLSQLRWIGLSSFLFGLLAPMVLVGFVMHAAKSSRRKLENQLSQALVQWSQAVEQNGPEPFRNPTFWLNVVLICIEHGSQHIDHPISLWSHDLSILLRKEIQKNKSSKVA